MDRHLPQVLPFNPTSHGLTTGLIMISSPASPKESPQPCFILPTTCRAWTPWQGQVVKVANRSLRGPNTRYFFHPGSERLFYFVINMAMSLPMIWIVSLISMLSIQICVTDLQSQQIWPDQGWFTQTLSYLPFLQRLALQSKSQSHPPRRIAMCHC